METETEVDEWARMEQRWDWRGGREQSGNVRKATQWRKKQMEEAKRAGPVSNGLGRVQCGEISGSAESSDE